MNPCKMSTAVSATANPADCIQSAHVRRFRQAGGGELLADEILRKPLYRQFLGDYGPAVDGLREGVKGGLKMVLYPASPRFGAIARKIYRSWGIDADCLCDRNPALWGTRIGGASRDFAGRDAGHGGQNSLP
jgi:hypothetical protein